MRDVGRVQRRLREDAVSASAPGGDKSPARAIGYIPLTVIPLTFPLSFPSSAALNGRRQFRDNLSYFEIIRDNSTSRHGGRGAMRPTPFLANTANTVFFLCDLCVLCGYSVSGCGLPPWEFCAFLRQSSPPRSCLIVPNRGIFMFHSPRQCHLPRISTANQHKRLSMNHLHSKPGRFQSGSIKPNQA